MQNCMHTEQHQKGLTLILYSVRLQYQWAYRPVEYRRTVCTVYVRFCAAFVCLYTIYLFMGVKGQHGLRGYTDAAM